MVKSNEVTAAPSHTSRQAMRTSGRSLNVMANSAVITAKEITKFTASSAAAGAGSSWPKYVPTATSQALSASETSSRNPIPTTMAKDRNRSLSIATTPRPDLGVTPQIVLSPS